MATVTCPKCGFEAEVKRTGPAAVHADHDLASFIQHCKNLPANAAASGENLDCADLNAAIMLATQQGRI